MNTRKCFFSNERLLFVNETMYSEDYRELSLFIPFGKQRGVSELKEYKRNEMCVCTKWHPSAGSTYSRTI